MRAPAAIAAALVLSACSLPGQVRYEKQLEGTSPEAAHAVHAERLYELMRSLDRLSHQRLPQAMDPAQERDARVREAREVALAIAEAATLIPEVESGTARSAPERREFAAHARVLEQRARGFAERAAAQSPEEMQAEGRAILEACAACHRRYRPGYEEGEEVP